MGLRRGSIIDLLSEARPKGASEKNITSGTSHGNTISWHQKKQKEMSSPISNERPPCNVSRGDIWWDQCHPPSGSFCSLLTNHVQQIPGLQTENKERPRKFHC
jgi:hypothetical protein